MQRLNELFRRYLGLPENACQGADIDVTVHGQDAALGLALHDDVGTALAHHLKAEPLKRAEPAARRRAAV